MNTTPTTPATTLPGDADTFLQDLPACAGTVLHQDTDLTGGHAAAITDTTGTYRYALTRIWDPTKPIACWIMLNPSVADHTRTDPTLTRVVDFTARARCGGLIIVNLFALRSTNPRLLRDHKDPVGPHNDTFIRHAVTTATGPVVTAWGAQGTLHDRAQAVNALLTSTTIERTCYGTTGPHSGYQPRHPLYVLGTTPLRPYTPGQPS